MKTRTIKVRAVRALVIPAINRSVQRSVSTCRAHMWEVPCAFLLILRGSTNRFDHFQWSKTRSIAELAQLLAIERICSWRKGLFYCITNTTGRVNERTAPNPIQWTNLFSESTAHSALTRRLSKAWLLYIIDLRRVNMACDDNRSNGNHNLDWCYVRLKFSQNVVNLATYALISTV